MMDTPPPPRDSSLRNIIDKLAEFVARNGPEFEMITKQKQHGNPKFDFLYGGEFANYYQYRVAAEQAFLKQQSIHPPNSNHQTPPPHHMSHHNQVQQQPSASTVSHHFTQAPPNQMQMTQTQGLTQNSHEGNNNYNMSLQQPPPSTNNSTNAAINFTGQIEAINMQQNTLREQIHQSESNLAAQHSAMMAQQAKQVEEAIEAAQNAQLEKQAEEKSITLRDYDAVLQPIIESCTKDSISAVANAEQRTKLTKLLSLWESKAKFFDACVISKLQSPDSSMQEYKTNLQNLHQDIVTKFAQNTKATLDNYQKQHQIFIQHATQQITQLEQQKQQLESQMLATVLPNAASILPINQAIPQQQQQQPQKQQQQQQQQQQTPLKIPSLMAQKISMPGDDDEHMKPPGVDDNNYGVNSNNNSSNNNRSGHHYQQQQPFDNNNINFGQQSTGGGGAQQNNFALDTMPQVGAGNFFIPDMSKPPPGFGSSGTNNVSNQMQTGLAQPYGPMNNIPHSVNSNSLIGSGVGGSDSVSGIGGIGGMGGIGGGGGGGGGVVGGIGASGIGALGGNIDGTNLNASAPNIDVLALNAAIQLVLKQNQLQNHPNQNLDVSEQQHLHQQMQLHQQQHPFADMPLNHDQQAFAQLPQFMHDNEEMGAAPPLGFMPPQMEMEEQMPSAPYYDLPAGLMVPLIRLDDYSYKPLDPADIRLPPPAPQSERLTNALAAFYAPPTHDRPRDTEGWEKLGLYEYYKVKNAAKKQKEEEIDKGEREKTRSPSPILLDKPKTKKIKKRYYRSKSRSRSRSRSPPPPRSNSNRRNRFKQRSRSPKRSPPPQRERNERERDSSSSSRENRPERANPRRERSVTPPSFFAGSFPKANEFIEETNRGHQMLKKMGWAGSGAGLGIQQQGIEQPIMGGDVRDRKDMFKGVGLNMNDPFENFRKNKGVAFVHRMRARDDKS